MLETAGHAGNTSEAFRIELMVPSPMGGQDPNHA